ncbi:hypothetical protein AB6H32_17720 [Providencia hangzhouensis]
MTVETKVKIEKKSIKINSPSESSPPPGRRNKKTQEALENY